MTKYASEQTLMPHTTSHLSVQDQCLYVQRNLIEPFSTLLYEYYMNIGADVLWCHFFIMSFLNLCYSIITRATNEQCVTIHQSAELIKISADLYSFLVIVSSTFPTILPSKYIFTMNRTSDVSQMWTIVYTHLVLNIHIHTYMYISVDVTHVHVEYKYSALTHVYYILCMYVHKYCSKSSDISVLYILSNKFV